MNLFYSLTVCLFALLCLPAKSQDYSNKGKDFWTVYPAHIDGNSSRMALYISSDIETSGAVFLNNTSIPFKVNANQATVVQIFPGIYPIINSQNEGTKTGVGIHIVSNDPVVVYAHILNSARSGSSLILPTKTLGREYTAISFKSSGNSPAGGANGSPSGSQFTIVGVENNTTVEITPSVTDVAATRPAGVPFSITLNQGDVYQFRSTYDKDITGTTIRSLATNTTSCKPIAVFSGSSWTSMNCSNASGGDNLFQQLMPLNSWGKNYITAPFADRQYDIFRIVLKDPATQVILNGTVLNAATLVNNTYYQFNSSAANVISTDKPVMVVQYMISQTCDTRNAASPGNPPYPGDPEMITLNPIEQTINDVTVVSARADLTPPNTNITKHFFTIILKTNSLSSLKIDGAAAVATPVVIGNTGYSYLQENVTASTNLNPSHRIKADSGFIALAYGLGNVESYGYNAGTNVKDLYQFVTVQNQLGTVTFPATCKNAPFFFSMTFPYQPTSINWVFGQVLNAMGIADVINNSPLYDSTWVVNGKQLYRYKLPMAYAITAVGTYPIKIVAQNPTPDGCSGEQEIDYDVQVFERPAANFSFSTSGCISDSVRFTDSSQTFTRPAIKWFWNFDDGQTSQIQNPSHLFASANPYNVKFSVVTDIGCVSDTVSKPVVLSQPPVAKFGAASPYCAGKVITFYDSSTSSAGNLVKWTWSFGDNSAAVVATSNMAQTHTYAASGTYTITLTVENVGGCRSLQFSKTIIVSPNQVAAFTFGKECLPGGGVQFTDASTISDGTQNLFVYAWKFGDGSTASVKNPSHNYTAVGPFQVILLVTSGAGCKDSVTKTVDSIYAQPVAKFTAPVEVCLGNSINFTDQSTAQNSTVVSWSWDFGDGTALSTQQNPAHTYAAAGTYIVKLTAVSAIGCQSSIGQQQVVVNPPPVAKFIPSSPACVTRTITFTDNSTAGAGALNKWTWNFGDASAPVTATTAAVQTHTYTATGTYIVTLQVETNKGCVSAVNSKPAVISPLPIPGFVLPGNCVNDPMSQFFDTTSIADGSGALFTYAWNFGDASANVSNPNTATAKNPTHRFTATGNYNVRLTVISSNGCADSITQVFTINGAVPVAAFTVQNGVQRCSNDSVSITDNSSVFPGKLVKLEIYWDYAGNPSRKTTVNNPAPGVTYSNKYPEFFTPSTKTYLVKLVAYSGLNCLTEKDTLIILKATPDINFQPVSGLCANEPVFQIPATVANMTGGNSVFSGTGVTASGLFTPATAGQGPHLIRYTYTGANGCTNFKEQTLSVYPVPTVSAGVDRFVLEGGTATLSASASGNRLTYLWSPSTYLNNAAVLQPVSTPTDDITYTLIVTSADGCSASDQVLVKVLKTPTIPNVFTPNGDGINDTWVIQYLESYPGATVDIFNRYGSLVYHSLGYPRAWDGTYNGKQMPAGTYYYVINPKNGRKQLTGFVDIVR